MPLLWAGRKGPASYTRYFALGMQLSPALQSPFSFHLGCGYDARKKKKKKKKRTHTRSLAKCCRVSSCESNECVMPACESKLASRSSRKATVAKAVFVQYRAIAMTSYKLRNFNERPFWCSQVCSYRRTGRIFFLDALST